MYCVYTKDNGITSFENQGSSYAEACDAAEVIARRVFGRMGEWSGMSRNADGYPMKCGLGFLVEVRRVETEPSLQRVLETAEYIPGVPMDLGFGF